MQILDFALRPRKRSLSAKSSVVSLIVEIAQVEIARLSISVSVSWRKADQSNQYRAERSWRTGFASYSSVDREMVMRLLGSIQAATGVDLFVDCLDLRSSDYWKPAIEREIDTRDRFLLFWSTAASKSKSVEWEWRHALLTKPLSRFQIHPMESNVAPPAELSELHFANRYLAMTGAAYRD